MPLPSYLLIHRDATLVAVGRHDAVRVVGENAGYSPVRAMPQPVFVPPFGA
jgi:hypothetical protein